MSDFRKFDHVERWGHPDVEAIEIGTVHVFSKLDGTNSSVWRGNGGPCGDYLVTGSRTKQLGCVDGELLDNHGFDEWVQSDEVCDLFHMIFADFPHWILYGEWLVPHTLKTYREEAWRRFWIFDVWARDQERYLPVEDYLGPLQDAGLDVIEPLCTFLNPSEEQLRREVESNTYLIRDGAGAGEGVVIKNYCPTPDQLVLTYDLRWVRAGELRRGDELLAFDENVSRYRRSRRLKPTMVTACDPGTQERFELTLSDGTVLRCTADHPWLVETKGSTFRWIKTKDLKPHHSFRRFFHPWGTADDYESGWLAGLYDGEGSVVNSDYDRVQLQVSQKPGPVADRICEILQEHGFNARLRIQNNGVGIITFPGGKWEELRLLGQFRPGRLLADLDLRTIGTLKKTGVEKLTMTAIESIGEGPVVQLETSTGTFFQEGFAAHNSWRNKYGRQPWAKIVRNEFKEENRRAFGVTEKNGEFQVEAAIAEQFVTPALVAKERGKIVRDLMNRHGAPGFDTDVDAFAYVEATNRGELIPRLLQTVYHSIVVEEMWTVVKKYKNPTIDFRKLSHHVTYWTKKHAGDLF